MNPDAMTQADAKALAKSAARELMWALEEGETPERIQTLTESLEHWARFGGTTATTMLRVVRCQRNLAQRRATR